MEEQSRQPSISPEQILKAMSMPATMTRERLAFAQNLSNQLASDPELMAGIARILQANGVELKRLDFASERLESFGWARDESLKAMPSPQQAAAAAAAGVAAMAAGAAAAVVA
jgi:hypothetical protein